MNKTKTKIREKYIAKGMFFYSWEELTDYCKLHEFRVVATQKVTFRSYLISLSSAL